MGRHRTGSDHGHADGIRGAPCSRTRSRRGPGTDLGLRGRGVRAGYFALHLRGPGGNRLAAPHLRAAGWACAALAAPHTSPPRWRPPRAPSCTSSPARTRPASWHWSLVPPPPVTPMTLRCVRWTPRSSSPRSAIWSRSPWLRSTGTGDARSPAFTCRTCRCWTTSATCFYEREVVSVTANTRCGHRSVVRSGRGRAAA
jgi:hypothetical protein